MSQTRMNWTRRASRGGNLPSREILGRQLISPKSRSTTRNTDDSGAVAYHGDIQKGSRAGSTRRVSRKNSTITWASTVVSMHNCRRRIKNKKHCLCNDTSSRKTAGTAPLLPKRPTQQPHLPPKHVRNVTFKPRGLTNLGGDTLRPMQNNKSSLKNRVSNIGEFFQNAKGRFRTHR